MTEYISWYYDGGVKINNYVTANVEEEKRMSRWKTIETAPKNGTKFIAWDEAGFLLFTMHWDDGWMTEYEQWSGTFTHWQRRPKPPSQEKSE